VTSAVVYVQYCDVQYLPHRSAARSRFDTLTFDIWGSVSTAVVRLDSRSSWRLGRSGAWITACHEPSSRPEQGWKLHVAAGLLTAEAVLRRSLPPILDEGVDFKVVASIWQLAALNEGLGGLSQVGKFITVYPNDDAQAVRLARALHEVTKGLAGPAILSDRALWPRSLVHYRYGGFGDLQMRTPLGELLPAIRAPDGSLVPDRRLTAYGAPSWAIDPFVAAGIVEEQPTSSRMIGDRYVVLAQLHASPRSQVYLCMDLSGPKICAVKRVADDGSGGLERLRNEYAVLSRLAPDPRFPGPIELFSEADDLCLAMEDLDGRTLEECLSSLRERNVLPDIEQLVRWTSELVGLLEAIHVKGLVYGDLKAPNVIVGADGQLRLVDFELAHDGEGERPLTLGRGTPGYMSPQQSAGRSATVADDIFGLGALLYLIATGAEPSFAPDPSALLDRPVELLNPALGRTVAAVIGRCLHPDPNRRPSSPAAAGAAIRKAARSDPIKPVAQPATPEQALVLARRIGDALCDAVSDHGLMWAHSGVFDEQVSLDLNTGAAGAILALAELVAEFDDPAHRAALARGARWLAHAPRQGDVRLPGLYVGEAGVGAALLRAGRVLADPELTGTAAKAGSWIASVPHSSPDLFNGTAGRLRYHLWLWLETADRQHLDHAIIAAAHLLAVAEHRAGGSSWTIPPGYERLSGHTLTGYAHGAAGIADTLLDLFEVTGDGGLLEVAERVGRWLIRLAEPALENGAGVNWPPAENDRPVMAFWCHGGAGITRFLLHLSQLTDGAEPLELARRAALVVAEGTRWAGVTQCHGLAGNVECLLDLYQATTEESYLREAETMARLVNAFAQKRKGRFTLITDRDSSNPGFSTGCSGVAVCLLRLAHPRTRPHLLSLRAYLPGASDLRPLDCRPGLD
jgi:hypothetical protein